MRRVPLAATEPGDDGDRPEGFRRRGARLGTVVGAERSGASLYELPPGQAVCPYHYEHADEEWLLVLSGHPSVRTPEGVVQLDPMDLVFFPIGPEGAHQIRNDTGTPVRILMWSTMGWPSVTVYPDSDKVGVYTRDGTDDVVVRRASGVGYYDGETTPEPPA